MNIKFLIILFQAIMIVETSENPYAINQKEQAYGPAQIRQAALIDINEAENTQYVLRDFLGNIPLSFWAFCTYGKLYHAKTAEEFARIWNGGPVGHRKHSTLKYWKKVKTEKEKLCAESD